jgi:DUF4097 and DUF4098 domain-containing protein YvlB
MRSRLTTLVIAAVVSGSGLAAAQSAQSGQGAADARARTRVIVEQQREAERERARQRIAQARGGHEETEKINRTVRIGGTGELIVSNLSGDITVTRGSGNDLQIEAIKVARGRNAEDAREMLGLVRVDVFERGSRVEVKAVYPAHQQWSTQQRRQLNVSVVYNITAPAGTRISAKSLSGSVKVTDIRGEISAASTSGEVTIVNAERISTAKSSSGNVQIMNSSSEIPFDAHSMSGNVVLRQVKATRIELGSISGNVMIAEVQAPQIEAQSISGDVEFASPIAKNGRYDFSSHAGTVRIFVMSGNGFEIDASTFAGSIQADASLNLKKDEEPGEPGRRRQRSLRAVFGDGSALIDASTFSGSVILTKK